MNKNVLMPSLRPGVSASRSFPHPSSRLGNLTSHPLHSLFLLCCLYLCTTACPSLAQTADSLAYVSVSGIVRDAHTKRVLEYVNVSVPGTFIGTVTNADGRFTLKASIMPHALEFSFVGYANVRLELTEGKTEGYEILMRPTTNQLDEVVVTAPGARDLVEKALQRIPANYPTHPMLLTGFYRETTQKRRNYISIAEAVVDVYKTSYTQSVTFDRVRIARGRRLLSQKATDTLAVKLLGGPTLALDVDMVKNKEGLLAYEDLDLYEFRMEEMEVMDDRPQYVVRFVPRYVTPDAQFSGIIYIDKERIAFTRFEFALDVSDRLKATSLLLRKKPAGLRFRPQECAYVISYRYVGGHTRLNYIRTTLRFRCDWHRRLFATNYTIVSEMAVTNQQDVPSRPFTGRSAFGPRDSFYDQVTFFEDPGFWGEYNIIEPTESLEQAVDRLLRRTTSRTAR